MKKILLVLVSFLLLCGLSGCKEKEEQEKYEYMTNKYYTSREEVENGAGIDIPFEMDADLAFEIGKAVLESHFSEEQLEDTHYELNNITAGDVYIVYKSPNGEDILGGGFGVAIDKKDGRILRIWISQ